jgi:hypothetical protein
MAHEVLRWRKSGSECGREREEEKQKVKLFLSSKPSIIFVKKNEGLCLGWTQSSDKLGWGETNKASQYKRETAYIG